MDNLQLFNSAPPRSQLFKFSISQLTHLSVFTLQMPQNLFLLKLHGRKYFQHYEDPKHLISTTNTTYSIGEKGRQVKAAYLIKYSLLPMKTGSSHFHRCRGECSFIIRTPTEELDAKKSQLTKKKKTPNILMKLSRTRYVKK